MVTAVGRTFVANNLQLVADTMRPISAKTDWGVDSDGVGNKDYGAVEGCTENNWDDCDRIAYGGAVTVGYEVRRILNVINYHTGWLYSKALATNDTVTAAGVSSSIGAWDRLLELVKLRNSEGEYYRLKVLNDGGVVYEKFSEDVSYIRYPLPRGIETVGNTTPTWDAKPGIIKRIGDSPGKALPSTWLSDNRLAYYERTVMRDGDSVATFHGREWDTVDEYSAVDANNRWIESRKARPKTKKEKVVKPEYDLYGHIIPPKKEGLS